MAICPQGHHSVDEAFCDTCGRQISRDQGMQHGGGPEHGQGGAAAPLCPMCRTRRDNGARYCEACRYDYMTGVPGEFAQVTAPDPAYDPSLYSPHQAPTDSSVQPMQPVQPVQPVQPMPPNSGPGPYTYDPYAQQSVQHAPGPTPPVHSAPTEYSPYATPADPQTTYPPADPHAYPDAHRPYPDPYAADGTMSPHQGAAAPPAVPQPHPTQPQYVWTLRVTADREYFDRVVAQGGPDAHAMRFPDYHEPWEVVLQGDFMRVGRRRSHSSTSDIEIDLSRPPADPGISHHHVSLRRDADGVWSVIDAESTNGTTINGGFQAIDVGIPVRLTDGDRVHVGAWTTLEVRLTPLH